MHLSRVCNYISAQQAAKALRPFYFAVHPDRFHYDPEARSNNEKSLQIFNGYLNDLFPRNGRQQNPVRVKFSLKREGDQKYDTVSIDLAGDNPSAIVESALRSINMAPDKPDVPQTKAFYDSAETSESLDELWQRMQERDVKTRKKSVIPVKPNDLFGQLAKNRDAALARAEAHLKTKEMVQDEIDYLIFKTGVLDVLWAMDWDQSYMRRCLSNVQQMITQSASDEKQQQIIINALRGHKLIFGRGSYICCDGSLQFGADDVPEKWQRVCLEANVRRLEIKRWKAQCDHVSALFGGAKLYIDPFDNLLRCIDQLRNIAVKISMKSRGEIIEMQGYAKNQTIEITSVYSELAILRDSRLQIPCNVDFKALVDFLMYLRNNEEQAGENTETSSTEYINAAAKETRKRLDLKGLTWDDEFPPEIVLDTFNRLECCDESVRNLIRGLAVHISTNPVIYVMSDGRFSIPTQWI
uniref:T-cell activation inhibitor, mitochondrial n=1 Tax=Panagrellus redivivus TaxID=6233 RepID=A0A7E4VN62_PANRE